LSKKICDFPIKLDNTVCHWKRHKVPIDAHTKDGH